jgi:hypothetical protein
MLDGAAWQAVRSGHHVLSGDAGYGRAGWDPVRHDRCPQRVVSSTQRAQFVAPVLGRRLAPFASGPVFSPRGRIPSAGDWPNGDKRPNHNTAWPPRHEKAQLPSARTPLPRDSTQRTV